MKPSSLTVYFYTFYSDCYEMDTKYTASTGVNKTQTNVVQHCQVKCTELPDCNVFSWDGKNCSLLTPLDYKVSNAQGYISGPKFCGRYIIRDLVFTQVQKRVLKIKLVVIIKIIVHCRLFLLYL